MLASPGGSTSRASRQGSSTASCPGGGCISRAGAQAIRVRLQSRPRRELEGRVGFGGTALEGNPYDGHTLQSTMDRIVATSGVEPEHAYVDMGYRGHDYEGECQIHVGRRRRGSIAKSLWRWMRRRAAIEPSIGHLKEHRRMERCRLRGRRATRSTPSSARRG